MKRGASASRARRCAAGLTLLDVATATHVDLSALARWERGLAPNLGAANADRVAAYYAAMVPAPMPDELAARMRAGLTVEALATKAGVSTRTVMRIERGGRDVTPKLAARVRSALATATRAA